MEERENNSSLIFCPHEVEFSTRHFKFHLHSAFPELAFKNVLPVDVKKTRFQKRSVATFAERIQKWTSDH